MLQVLNAMQTVFASRPKQQINTGNHQLQSQLTDGAVMALFSSGTVPKPDKPA